MQVCSLSFNAYWLDGEGRIINCYGERVFSDRVWEDEMSADFWLNFISPDGRFGTAYIAGTVDYVPVSLAGQHKDIDAEAASKALDRWLMQNGLMGSAPDAELLDALPTHLRAMYEKRLGLKPEDDDEHS